MRLHGFKNYKQYVKTQSTKNKRQLDRVWAVPEEMASIAHYVRKNIEGASFGICHGAKHGWEVEQLRDQLGIEVIGTDISTSAKKFDYMIQHDFHEAREEWVGKTSFIYTNCLDHSYDPELALDTWMSCLTPNGRCFIEWSEWHGEEHSTPEDPFGASLEEYRELVTKKYSIEAEIDIPFNAKNPYPLARLILVIAPATGSDDQ